MMNIEGRALAFEAEPEPESGTRNSDLSPDHSHSDSVASGASGSIAPRNDLELRLFEIWRLVLETSSFGVTDAFYDLGGDSLKAVTMMGRVECEFSLNLPPTQLYETPTIEALADSISRGAVATAAEQATRRVFELRTGATRAPLFCFPGVGGDVTSFRLLAERLEPAQGVQGVLYPDLERATPPVSMEALAASCLIGIKSVQPEGPYFLGGYSFGGSVAYEVAQQLRAANEQVAVLALWDADLDTGMLRIGITRALLNFRGIASWPLRMKVSYMAGEFARHLRSLFGAKPPDESESTSHDSDRRIMTRMVRFQAAAMAIHQRYKHLPYDGRMFLFCADGGALRKDLSYWLRLAIGGIEACAIPGDHSTMLQEPNVSRLGEVLQKCLSGNG